MKSSKKTALRKNVAQKPKAAAKARSNSLSNASAAQTKPTESLKSAGAQSGFAKAAGTVERVINDLSAHLTTMRTDQNSKS